MSLRFRVNEEMLSLGLFTVCSPLNTCLFISSRSSITHHHKAKQGFSLVLSECLLALSFINRHNKYRIQLHLLLVKATALKDATKMQPQFTV